MSLRDIKSNVDATQSIAPALRTASVNGTGVDTRGHDSAMAVFNFGACTDGTFTPKLQESDDDITYTDVAAVDQEGSLSAVSNGSNENASQRAGYKGSKRYFRATVTEAGASPAPSTGCSFGAVINRGNPHGAPTA